MGWDGPILTDSGGFQVFSLADRSKLTDAGVAFRSHIDGRLLELTPERAVADPGGPRGRRGDVPRPVPGAAGLEGGDRRGRRPHGPLGRAVQGRPHSRPDQALFGIVQGGSHADLRAECAERSIALDFAGYAVGGVSVGESREEVRAALEVTTPPAAGGPGPAT